MLAQRARKPKRPPVAQTMTFPAPVGGLNARDAIALMPPTDALILDNMFPGTTSVALRNGYVEWSTGYPADVESLMTYSGPTSSKLFAASGTAFYDATAQGAVGAAVVSGLTNSRWQHVNMGTPGGQFLVTVNGVDFPRLYTGSEWRTYSGISETGQTISSITHVGTTATLTTAAPHGLVTGNSVTITGTTPAAYSGTFLVTVTGASTFTYTMLSNPGGVATIVGTYTVFTITGVDPSKFIHVNAYSSRLFFVEKDSPRIWYLPLNSISGAAVSIDFSPLMSLGGYLMAMATWTIDNAAGVNEYAIFITSEGEVIMYSGTDPSDPDQWIKNGRYRVGRPVGRRCYVLVSSDVILINNDGFMPMSKAILTDRSQEDAISDKITDLVSLAIANYGDNFGWQGTYYPVNYKLIFNVPQIEGSMQYQFVMNTITGAWCRFTNWNANVFEVMGQDCYFGSNLGTAANSAFVAKCDTGYSDNGAYIFGEPKTAFQYFGAPGLQKQITMVKPIFTTSGEIQAAIAMDMDFANNYPIGAPTFTQNNGTPWNTALWNTFLWATGPAVKLGWQGVTGVGDAGALHMRLVNNATPLTWQSIQYLVKIGGYL